MEFQEQLIKGKLIKRYKRFLADIKLEDGTTVIAHCTNSGSMKTCLENNASVYLSPANDPSRKTQFTWEMIEINNSWVGVNTMIPNQLIYEAIINQEIPQLKGYNFVKREVKFEDSRFDIYAENDQERCFIEVKNVSMKVGNFALFPDSITSRGRKHLNTLIRVKEQGLRAVMVYVIQRMDVNSFGAAINIDPNYAESLEEARKAGVEVIALQVKVTPREIRIIREIQFTSYREGLTT